MMNVLVTGGAGFIGSHLCEALLERGYTVTCLDDFRTGKRGNIQHLSSLRVLEGDANKWDTFRQLAGERYDALFHYAATVGVRRTVEQPNLVVDDVLGIRNVARFAREGGATKVLFASSSEVYGEPRVLPEVEEAGGMAWNLYATVKLYGEYVLQTLWSQHHIPTVSLRFFNVYGPRQAGNAYGFVTAHFLEQVYVNTPPTVFGDGMQTRDFVYVKDNVRVALAALECNAGGSEVANVGTGQETTVLLLAETAIRATGKEGMLFPVFLPPRAVEIRRRCASIERMQALFGVKCDTSLHDGLHATIQELYPHNVEVAV